ncbi:MAG TPA: hypothetical protein VNZ86_10325 [Bacteroidia bacterium]|jgi:hypothetical protein|nr:hypothetical protein [Bacteroidia bacterium]
MDHIEALYYALGEVCYAIAKSTGRISQKEKDRLHVILKSEFREHNGLIDPAEIIFHILQKEGMDSKTVYSWAMHEFKLNSEYLSESLKSHFIHVIQKVVNNFPSVTKEEHVLVNDFMQQLKTIKGDPVFSHLTS